MATPHLSPYPAVISENRRRRSCPYNCNINGGDRERGGRFGIGEGEKDIAAGKFGIRVSL